MWLVEERCAVIFQSDKFYDFHLTDEKMGVQSEITYRSMVRYKVGKIFFVFLKKAF